MADFDEQSLIERCRAGDDAAFSELVDRYKNLVYALVYRMVPDRSRTDDLAQDVFLKVYRGLPVLPWRRAAVDVDLSHRAERRVLQARTQRRPEVSLEPDANGRVRIEPAAADAAFAELETRDRLEKAIQQLPDNYRLLIAAHYLQGVQYEDLAAALNIPLGTVKTHLHRAKRRLREILDPDSRIRS